MLEAEGYHRFTNHVVDLGHLSRGERGRRRGMREGEGGDGGMREGEGGDGGMREGEGGDGGDERGRGRRRGG